MQFNHFVKLSFENNLCIRTTFQTGGHGLNKTNVLNYFFGTQTMTQLPENTTCTRKRIQSLQSLPAEAFRAKKEASCVVFTIKAVSPAELGVKFLLPYYRRLFEGNEVARNYRSTIKREIKRRWETPNRSNVVHVAVHIRRGDLKGWLSGLNKGKTDQTEKRLVHENMYTTVLNQLLMKLEELGKFEVDVRLHCEGMKPPASVPKASDWSLSDLSKGVIFDRVKQNVTILPSYSDDTLQAWDDMCFSDVIITGTSGFSHLTSILCNTPVILAVPFWHSYDYIPNAITLDVEREATPVPAVGLPIANLIYRASFNETLFESLWYERFPIDSYSGGEDIL